MLLPDDDVFARSTYAALFPSLERHPRVGVIHTSYDVIDADSHMLVSDVRLLKAKDLLTIESRDSFLERSMRSPSWTVCWASAIFRLSAISKSRRAEGARRSVGGSVAPDAYRP